MTALKGLLTCCLLTFSYFVTFFYCSMIKTDMVSVKAPRVIGSYQDILDDREIQPYIMHFFDEYASFKKAPQGSLKRKIWERIVNMGVGKIINSHMGLTLFLDVQHPVMNTKGVLMGYASQIEAAKYASGLYLKSVTNRRVLYVFDPTESAKLSGSVINRMTSEATSHMYEVRMRRFFEGHLWHEMMDNIGLLVGQFFADMRGLGKDISDVEEYVGQRVVLPDPVLVKPDVTYFMSLFITYLVLCFAQLILFLIERWVSDTD